MNYLGFSFYIEKDKDIPGGPVVKTSSRVHRFDPRSENLDPACLPVWQIIFSPSSLIYLSFYFVIYSFGITSKKPGFWKFTLRNSEVLAVTFNSVINFEIIYIYYVR